MNETLLQPFIFFGYYFIVKLVSEMIKKIIKREKKIYFLLWFIVAIIIFILFYLDLETPISEIIMGVSILACEIMWQGNKRADAVFMLLIGIVFILTSNATTFLHYLIALILLVLCSIILKFRKRINYSTRVIFGKK